MKQGRPNRASLPPSLKPGIPACAASWLVIPSSFPSLPLSGEGNRCSVLLCSRAPRREGESARYPESETCAGGAGPAAGWGGSPQRAGSDAWEAEGSEVTREDLAASAHVSSRFKSWQRAESPVWQRSRANSRPRTQTRGESIAWSAGSRAPSRPQAPRCRESRTAASGSPPHR